jgi:hypothetical protein
MRLLGNHCSPINLYHIMQCIDVDAHREIWFVSGSKLELLIVFNPSFTSGQKHKDVEEIEINQNIKLDARFDKSHKKQYVWY